MIMIIRSFRYYCEAISRMSVSVILLLLLCLSKFQDSLHYDFGISEDEDAIPAEKLLMEKYEPYEEPPPNSPSSNTPTIISCIELDHLDKYGYYGSRNRDITGKRCMQWADTVLSFDSITVPEYPTEWILPHNFCRRIADKAFLKIIERDLINERRRKETESLKKGPWCFVENSNPRLKPIPSHCFPACDPIKFKSNTVPSKTEKTQNASKVRDKPLPWEACQKGQTRDCGHGEWVTANKFKSYEWGSLNYYKDPPGIPIPQVLLDIHDVMWRLILATLGAMGLLAIGGVLYRQFMYWRRQRKLIGKEQPNKKEYKNTKDSELLVPLLSEKSPVPKSKKDERSVQGTQLESEMSAVSPKTKDKTELPQLPPSPAIDMGLS